MVLLNHETIRIEKAVIGPRGYEKEGGRDHSRNIYGDGVFQYSTG
jgi:hypothetical protein